MVGTAIALIPTQVPDDSFMGVRALELLGVIAAECSDWAAVAPADVDGLFGHDVDTAAAGDTVADVGTTIGEVAASVAATILTFTSTPFCCPDCPSHLNRSLTSGPSSSGDDVQSLP